MARYLSQSRIEDPIWLEPNDIAFLQTRISEAETVVQRIENQTMELGAQVTAEISELTRQKDAKLAEIISLRNVLAPVRRVPLEILSEMFELSCLPKDNLWKTDLVRSTFALSGVCAAWRKAAHATPRLWCRLDILSPEQLLGSDFVWVHSWIARGQGLPLDLYLNLHVRETHKLRDILKQRGKEFLEFVLAHFSHQIRVLNMFGNPSSFFPILQLPLSSPLLSLERLSLSPLNHSKDSMEQIIECSPAKVEVFLGSPRLREVTINSPSLLKLLALPAGQLTFLRLKPDWKLAVFRDVLSQCKNLVSLDISSQPLSVCGESSTIFLPALKSLWVTSGYSAVSGNFLQCLTAPLLENLLIEYDSRDLDRLANDLTAFQQRSATRPSALTLTHHSCGSEPPIEKVVTILLLFPTICMFEFRPSFGVDSLIQTLTCTEDRHVLPNLKHLVLHTYTLNKYLNASVFKSMVLSRWWPDRLESDRNGLCCLQKVTIRGFHFQGLVEDITDLSALSGLILDYTPTKHQS